ncbi:MAG TPA: ATP-binding protein [Phycisphaerae bacterium]|nr:ATP-binding protein [Phycisphaerae bacterium]
MAIPNWAALSLAGLYLGVIVALGLVAIGIHRQASRELREAQVGRQAVWLARAIHLAGGGNDSRTVAAELRRAKNEPGILRCEIVDRQGTVVAAADCSRVGKQIDETVLDELIGVNEVEVSRLNPGGNDGMSLHAIRLIRPKANSQAATVAAGESASSSPAQAAETTGHALATPLAWLLIETSTNGDVGLGADWLMSVGCVALAAMGAFWLVYRILSRSLHPLAAIRQRLLTFSESLSDRLALLRLNDSMDQSAAAWNRLVEFTHDLQQEVQSTKLRSAVGSSLDAYRSERLAAVLRQMPHGMLVLEEGGQVSFANRSAARMLNQQEDELTGKTLDRVLPEGLHAEALVAGRGAGRWVDHTIENAEGSTTIRFASVPLDKDAQAGGSVVFIQDVSQFKEMERAQEAFLYHVTHELRTPLTSIRAYAETLADGVLDDPTTLRECYNVISGETERLSRLVEAILNISQLQVGTARLNFGDVHVDRMIRDVVQDMQAHASAKGIDLRLRLPPKLPVIRGDKERLAVVLANLVGNAVKYTPSGGHVEVLCATEPELQSGREPTSLRVSVSDTGIGIAPEHHEKIFDKFYRVRDEQVEAEPGTGLGLAIVKETVRLHGGSITMESTPGRGSTFHVTFPVRGT